MARSSAARQVGGGLGPTPLVDVVGASPAAHPASGTPLYSALGWVFRSADRTIAPPPCGLTYGGCPLPFSARGCGPQQRGPPGGGGWGGLGPAPVAAVVGASPAAHPASGTPLRSAVGWVFRYADRTNAPPPCGLTYRGCPLPFPGGDRGPQERGPPGGGDSGPRPSGGRCWDPPRGASCIGHPPP